jgi:UDP:flavonoid glycosyltransferase YjiC (YdhE family)
VIQAAAPLDCQIVVASAELARSPLAGELSGRALLVEYAPQPALLARARGFVTHGGANSVAEALASGTPMLVCPVDLDQFFQAGFVPASGAGLSVDLLAAPEEEVRRALAAILAESSPYRARALEMAEEYRRRDGAGEVARRLVALAGG